VKRSKQNETGLTLIEVLIALIILSVALTAVIKSASENIRNTLYLQNRTIATWVGANVMNSIRIGVIQIPGTPDHLSKTDRVLNQNWNWEAVMNSTPNPRIKQIVVDVYHSPDHHPLTHLESYVYAG